MATPFGQAGSMYGETGRDSMKGNKKSKSVRPSNVNKSIKVSQSEINSIKKMGMSKALASAGSASASMQEGIRRLYGERRYQAATYKPNNVVMGTPTAGYAPKKPMGTPTAGYAPKKPMGTPTAGYAPKKTTYQTGENSRAVKKVAPKKDTSFKKSGVSGVLKSPEAKKFRSTFAKKGLIPALRGK
jgi:hypothetical protein